MPITIPKYVELLNLPEYRQGTHDALCTYYACAILLGTLFPQYQADFGERLNPRGRRPTVLDPLIRHASRKSYGPDAVIASWFQSGQSVRNAHILLNRIARADRHGTRFIYWEGSRRDRTFDRIARSIDAGLPVIVGWNSLEGDLGAHTVVVHAYDTRGRLRWINTRDPGGDERLPFDSLWNMVTTPLAVIAVDHRTHGGTRPDRFTVLTTESRAERWWCRDGRWGYFDVDELRQSAMGGDQPDGRRSRKLPPSR